MYPLYRIQKVWVFNGMGHKMIKTQQTGSIYLHFTPKSGKKIKWTVTATIISPLRPSSFAKEFHPHLNLLT